MASPLGGREKLAVPTPIQREWHDMELGMFVHWGPFTYAQGRGKDFVVPAEEINPVDLDTDQWADVAVAMGAKYVVFVAKHADGFCSWQTDSSPYGLRQSPWKSGKGDIVASLAESCRKKGLKLGIYLSPRDRTFGAKVLGLCDDPESQARYDAVYRQQLTELLTRYGPICEVWFDGSLAVEVGDILERHAPDAVVFQGKYASIRWVGNENGIATYPAWNAVSKEDALTGRATNRHGNPGGDVWLPLECDARIRAHWYWQPDNADTLKSVDELMDMYYRSVGHGAVLLLNHTPDPSGRIPEADARRAAEFGAEIRRRFSTPRAETSGEGRCIEIAFSEPATLDHSIAMEEIAYGERVRSYVVEGWSGGRWQRLASGTAIGHKKIDAFPAVTVERLRLRVLESVGEPVFRKFAAYHTGVSISTTGTDGLAGDAITVGDWGPEIFFGGTYGKSPEKELAYDITAACDNAGQFEVRFVKTGGASDLVITHLEVVYGGRTYPGWIEPAGGGSFILSLSEVGDPVRLVARVRGERGTDTRGRILVRRVE